MFLSLLIQPDALPHTPGTIFTKQAVESTTLAADVDVAAAAWTWSKVNITAGQYVVVAHGPDFAVASPKFVIADGADTSCFTAGVDVMGGSIAILSATSTSTPTPQLFVPRSESSGDGYGSPDVVTIIASMFGGTTVILFLILLAVAGYRRARRRRREQPCPSSPSLSPAEAMAHPDRPDLPSLSVAYYATHGQPDASEKDAGGGIDPIDSPPADSRALVPNRRPPSSILSEPNGIPPYTPQPRTRELMAGSIMGVSTIGSRSSTAPSDAPSTAGLMGTFSSCPPSYATSPSHPPSYVTGARTPRSGHLSYASSS